MPYTLIPVINPSLPFLCGNRRVILKDPYRGLELVSAVQESILDPSPSISALGLRVLTAMCEAQVLDFYKAFKVCSSADLGSGGQIFFFT